MADLSNYPEILSTEQISKILGIGKNGVKPLKEKGWLLEIILPGRKRPAVTKSAVKRCIELMDKKSMEVSI